MGERLSEENIQFLHGAVGGLFTTGDESAIDMFKQALEVVLGQREWVQLPSGRSFRLNTDPSSKTLSILPEGQRVVVQVRDPALDDWAKHQEVRGRQVQRLRY